MDVKPPDASLLWDIIKTAGAALGALAMWVWARISNNSREIIALKQDVQAHREEVAKTYPSTPMMEKALQNAVQPINEKLNTLIGIVEGMRNRELENAKYHNRRHDDD